MWLLLLQLRDLGSNIRIASVSPGIVATEFAAVARNSKEEADEVYRNTNVLHAEDIAQNVKHILELPKHV